MYMIVATLRTNTDVRILATAVVLPAVLAGVIGFCVVYLVLRPLLLYVVVYSPSVFSSSSLILVYLMFFLLFMSWGEGERGPVPFRCCRWSFFVPFVLHVLHVRY